MEIINQEMKKCGNDCHIAIERAAVILEMDVAELYEIYDSQ
jgi:hypothetical protein